MILNDAGKCVRQCWLDIPAHFPHAAIDEYVVMPNHVHGIINIHDFPDTPVGGMESNGERIVAANGIVGVNKIVGVNDNPVGDSVGNSVGANNYSPLRVRPQPPHREPRVQWAREHREREQNPNIIPIRGTTKTIGSMIRGCKIGVTKWFRSNSVNGEIWQRSYYDRIVRNDKSLYSIRKYIRENPIQWSLNSENHLAVEEQESQEQFNHS